MSIESKEKIRVAAHEAALRGITNFHEFIAQSPGMSLDELVMHQAVLRDMLPGYQWEEFAQRASEARSLLGKYLAQRLEYRKRYEVARKTGSGKRLRAKIRSEIMTDLTEKSAEEIADAILAGKVRHVRVVF